MCFLRINTSSAPLNPPGAAPTLTTVYPSSTSTETSASASFSKARKDQVPSKTPKKRPRIRLLRKAAPPTQRFDNVIENAAQRAQRMTDDRDPGSDLEISPEQIGKAR